ncbi:MAG: NAD(P)(+) transhydrogenase (Re/Si-specific) subunit beta [Coriobacteriia bacterium]|nr:NAD(P)(+) transhydrogenase (Re/Si-specific) subunit beta [Coriobacteriia bacterium]
METWYGLAVDLIVIAVFIAGIAQFRTPRGARRGNLTTAIAFAATLGLIVYRNTVGYPLAVIPAAVIGGIAGWTVSARVNMTRIPALIALQNGAGGGASLLVSLVELGRATADTALLSTIFAIAGVLVGGVALSGSLVAAAKLENRLSPRPRTLPGHNLILVLLLTTTASMSIWSLSLEGTQRVVALALLAGATLVFGVTFSVRVGGADMPVMISLLNAFSGLAAAFVGVAIGNQMLTAAGAMVGSSGTVLTLVMAKAMNRSVGAILAGRQLAEQAPAAPACDRAEAPETENASVETAQADASTVREAGPADDSPARRATAALAGATSVIIVPGYGMALAQAQHEVAELAAKLESAGKLVRFAVHPVAGRMPGHMHVLLAEADVEYDKLYEMDAINDEFSSTDVAIIVGACDVVNPAAITVADTPISGMPILNAHEAKAVIVCNLDEKPGYSGVPNPLYDDPGTIMLLGDAKETVARLTGGPTG